MSEQSTVLPAKFLAGGVAQQPAGRADAPFAEPAQRCLRVGVDADVAARGADAVFAEAARGVIRARAASGCIGTGAAAHVWAITHPHSVAT